MGEHEIPVCIYDEVSISSVVHRTHVAVVCDNASAINNDEDIMLPVSISDGATVAKGTKRGN